MAGATQVQSRRVTITRTFDAPPEAVWRAWTEPALFARWFSTPPYHTPVETVSMDVRPDGEWRATQVSEDGSEKLPFLGRYLEVDPPRRLVMRFENPQDRDDPNVEKATVSLEPADSGTLMTFAQEGHMPPEQYQLLAEGYSRFFDRLEQVLRGER